LKTAKQIGLTISPNVLARAEGHGPTKKKRAEFKFDERSVAPDGYRETLTTSSLLETPVLFYGRLDPSVSAGRRYLGSPQKEA
jgi:hypothetical protein